MATGKHAPNRRDKYFEIHATVMARRRDEGFVVHDGLVLGEVEGGYLMSGRIECQGGLAVDVRKRLRIVSGKDSTAIVQTVEYTYHVIVEGLGNLLRYCSPHADEAHPEHRHQHHRHVYDPISGDVAGRVGDIDEDAWPTLGQVIEEARDGYYEHASAIEGGCQRGTNR